MTAVTVVTMIMGARKDRHTVTIVTWYRIAHPRIKQSRNQYRQAMHVAIHMPKSSICLLGIFPQTPKMCLRHSCAIFTNRLWITRIIQIINSHFTSLSPGLGIAMTEDACGHLHVRKMSGESLAVQGLFRCNPAKGISNHSPCQIAASICVL